MLFQYVLVTILFVGAGAYLANMVRKQFGSEDGCTKGCCDSGSKVKSKKETNLTKPTP